MITTSAPAPVPSANALSFIATVPRQRRKPDNPQKCEREAMAAIVSVIRNVRYDIDRARLGKTAPVSPEYLIRVGLQIVEIADAHRAMQPRDWDAIIDRVTMQATTIK